MATPETTPAQRLARFGPAAVLGYGVVLYGLDVMVVPNATLAIALTVVGYLALTALVLVGAAGLSARTMPRWAEPLQLVVGTAVWSAFTHVPHRGNGLPSWAAAGAATAMIVATVGLARLLVTWLLKEKNLLPVCLVLMGVVDLWGVTFGFTGHMLAVNPEAVAKASAALPAVKSSVPLPSGFQLPDLTIGPGDVLFMALVLGVVARHGLSLRANLRWMYGLLMIGLGLALFTPWAIPGLVFVGAAGLIANRGQWDYSVAERQSLKLAAAIMVPLLVAAGLYYQAHKGPEPPPGQPMDRGNDGKG